jgi:hypothetical protein
VESASPTGHSVAGMGWYLSTLPPVIPPRHMRRRVTVSASVRPGPRTGGPRLDLPGRHWPRTRAIPSRLPASCSIPATLCAYPDPHHCITSRRARRYFQPREPGSCRGRRCTLPDKAMKRILIVTAIAGIVFLSWRSIRGNATDSTPTATYPTNAPMAPWKAATYDTPVPVITTAPTPFIHVVTG